jgi:hypothetical protein
MQCSLVSYKKVGHAPGKEKERRLRHIYLLEFLSPQTEASYTHFNEGKRSFCVPSETRLQN